MEVIVLLYFLQVRKGASCGGGNSLAQYTYTSVVV